MYLLNENYGHEIDLLESIFYTKMKLSESDSL